MLCISNEFIFFRVWRQRGLVGLLVWSQGRREFKGAVQVDVVDKRLKG